MRFSSIGVFCVLSYHVTAQSMGASSIGYIGSPGAATSFFSNSNIISGGSCLRLASGAACFNKPGDGVFFDACFETGPTDSGQMHFGIYPNPFRDFVTIRLLGSTINSEKTQVCIYAINGMLVKTLDVTVAEIAVGYKINLAWLAAGTYVVTVSSKNLFMADKIIKSE